MVDAIGYQYLPKYYGVDGQTQEVGQAEPATEESGSQAESIYSSDEGTDKVQSPYSKAIGTIGSLRKMSVENLMALGKLKSDKAEELVKEHSDISDECWARLFEARETADSDSAKFDAIVQDMKIKFLNLIEKEKTALKKTDEIPDTTESEETPENRTLAIA